MARAWCPTARTALDLGSGIGTVGMICAWRLPGAKFVTVEAQSESVALAKKSARYNGLEDRYEIREGDFRDAGNSPRRGKIRSHHRQPAVFSAGRRRQKRASAESSPAALNCAARLPIIARPPPASRARRIFCVRVSRTNRRSSRASKPPQKIPDLVIVRKRPVVFREGDPPLVALFGLMRAEDLPEWFRGQTWTEPDLIIRTRDGKIHPEYSAVKLAIGFPP